MLFLGDVDKADDLFESLTVQCRTYISTSS